MRFLGAQERTGAAVVAAQRDDRVFVIFDEAFQVRPEDLVFVCGTLGSLDRRQREFQAAPAEGPRS